MAVHDPEGKTICVHSVCIDPRHQRQGIGSALLKEYIKRWRDGPYHGISLISHEELIKLYVAAGFKLIGKSEVVHGSKPWFELRYSLRSQELDVTTQRRILEVLQEQSNQSGVRRTEKKLASYFSGGSSELADEQGLNKWRLYCPRLACRSIILLEGTARLEERSSIMVIIYIIHFANPCILTFNQIDDPQNLPPPDLLPHLLPEPISVWKIGPPASPMVFENMGFSKSLPTDGSHIVPPGGSRPVKLLMCAECDLGPLGWVEGESSSMSYWLIVNRVGYM